MINFKRLHFVLLGILLSSLLNSALLAQQITRTYQPPVTYQDGSIINGRIINGPVIQGQRVIQGQILPGQVIQGQPVQGQINQGQPIQGQAIQGPIIQRQPFIQGPVLQGRPVRGDVVPTQQAAPRTNQQLSAQQQKAAATARTKIEEQAKNIKALTAENSRLSRVEDTNNAMRKEYARLKKAYDDVSKELDQLKLNQAMNSAEPSDSDAQQAKLNQLNAQYQKAVEQNGTMAEQVKLLAQENAEIKNRLQDLSAAGGDMASLKKDLDTANSKILEIERGNKSLADENNRLQGALQAATFGNENLNMRFSALSQESDQLRAQYQTATETNTALGQKVTELSTQNKNYLASITSRPDASTPAVTNVAAKRIGSSVDSGLAEERDRILALNADLESKNGLLKEQTFDLETKIGRFETTTAPTESLLSAAVPAVTTDATSKFNILNWLIPFLLIGLTIGLYVFLTEENGSEFASTFTSTRPQVQNDADQR